jgi:hypothetical protein
VKLIFDSTTFSYGVETVLPLGTSKNTIDQNKLFRNISMEFFVFPGELIFFRRFYVVSVGTHGSASLLHTVNKVFW